MRTGDICLKSESPFKSLDYAVITEEIRLRAEKELGETDETRENCLQELKILLKGEKELAANSSDEFLIQFLRAKKYKTKCAFATLKKFYNLRSVYRTIFQNYSPQNVIEVLQSNTVNFLPLRTSEDCAVLVVRAGLWDPKDFDFESLLKFGIMCHEQVLRNPVTQICGIVSIVDLQGFSLTHLFHMPPPLIRCFVSLSQDCLPIRHRAIHIVNNPSVFGLLFAIIKPLLTNKIRNRIHFHGYDLSSLHKYVPPSILPEELGGTQGPFKNEQFNNSLLESEDQFLDDQKYGYGIKHK